MWRWNKYRLHILELVPTFTTRDITPKYYTISAESTDFAKFHLAMPRVAKVLMIS